MDPVTVRLLTGTASTKNGRKIIIGVIAAVLAVIIFAFIAVGGILSGIFYLINPNIAGKESESVHYQAIQEVKAALDIENDFDSSWLVMIDMLAHHSVMRDRSDAASFLESYFVVRHEEVIVHEPDTEYEDSWEETIIYYLFADGADLMKTIMSAPFDFTDDDVDTIRNMIYYEAAPIVSELVFNGKFPMPISGGINSPYGWRLNPETGEKEEFHDGLDIGGVWHDNVLAIADGVVYSSNIHQVYGNNIIIEHNIDGEKFYSLYAHLSQRKVSAGQKVKQGQVIGIEGGALTDPNPGRSTGHHLHFGILVNPNYASHIDPTGYLYR